MYSKNTITELTKKLFKAGGTIKTKNVKSEVYQKGGKKEMPWKKNKTEVNKKLKESNSPMRIRGKQ